MGSPRRERDRGRGAPSFCGSRVHATPGWNVPTRSSTRAASTRHRTRPVRAGSPPRARRGFRNSSSPTSRIFPVRRARGTREGASFSPGKERRFEVDRVLALVGYRPDLSLFRELQIHLCYASEGPMALAAAILGAQGSDPASGKGCLDQVAHGPESLKNPEPDFYVLGAKSYGRNPNFLLSLGHRQIEDVMTLLGAAEPRLNAAAR